MIHDSYPAVATMVILFMQLVAFSKNDGFSLSSGDFPSLGSERENSGKKTDSQGDSVSYKNNCAIRLLFDVSQSSCIFLLVASLRHFATRLVPLHFLILTAFSS